MARWIVGDDAAVEVGEIVGNEEELMVGSMVSVL